MQEEFHQWYSPTIGTDIRLLSFGTGGIPVLLFPTSMGRYYEAKDRHLIEAAAGLIHAQKCKIYCIDSFDQQSWYNHYCPPNERAYNHSRYDLMILDEVVSRMRNETAVGRIATVGCSFGGYHAANFAFRHPETVSYLFSLSGIFDIRSRLDGYYDDYVYFNNPIDFVPNMDHPDLWKMGIILGTGEHDICRGYNEAMSDVLLEKKVGHWLDIRMGAEHDWPLWLEMFPHYLSLMK